MAVTAGHGNPKWSREETVLALELYIRALHQLPGPADPRVISLSSELRELPIHPPQKRRPTFRNPDGVAFKLQNLRSVAEGRGLQNASAMDRKVWEEFGFDAVAVEAEARRIREQFRAKRLCFG